MQPESDPRFYNGVKSLKPLSSGILSREFVIQLINGRIGDSSTWNLFIYLQTYIPTENKHKKQAIKQQKIEYLHT